MNGRSDSVLRTTPSSVFKEISSIQRTTNTTQVKDLAKDLSYDLQSPLANLGIVSESIEGESSEVKHSSKQLKEIIIELDKYRE